MFSFRFQTFLFHSYLVLPAVLAVRKEVWVVWSVLGWFGVFQRTGNYLSLNNYAELNGLSFKRASLVSVNNLQICHIKDPKICF